jgi:hypothetical protein
MQRRQIAAAAATNLRAKLFQWSNTRRLISLQPFRVLRGKEAAHMATASLGLERSLPAVLPAQPPAIWLRRHAYVLAAVTALQMIGCRYALRLVDANWLGEAMIGVMLAQCFLLGLWGALGGLATLPRWGVIGLVHVGGLLAITIGIHGGPGEALAMGLVGAMVVLIFAACLMPLRGLAGWRIDFDSIYYRNVRGRRGQIGLMDYAAYSLGVAAALAAVRLAIQAEVLDPDTLLVILAVLLTVLLVAAPVTYAIVTWRRLWLALVAAAVWTLGVAGAHSLLASVFEDLDFFGSTGPYLADMHLPLLGFCAGAALLVAATMTTLRLFGLRLITVPLPAASTQRV